MTGREDSDVKIFKPSKKADKDGGMLSFVEGMNYHRQNGNVDKAKELGKGLALSYHNENNQIVKLSSNVFMTEPFFPQVCTLMLFSIEAALNYYLPSQQLSTIAINAFHEELSSDSLPLYETAMASPAFSFYYLSVRKGGDNIPKDIGEAFAMLCHRENDVDFIDEGKSIYTQVLAEISKRIVDEKFEN